jgi:hypothetical protein
LWSARLSSFVLVCGYQCFGVTSKQPIQEKFKLDVFYLLVSYLKRNTYGITMLHLQLIAGIPPRLPAFDPRSSHVRFMVEKLLLWQTFSGYFGFPYQFSLRRQLHTHLSSGAGTVGPLVADVPSGLSLTPPHE